MTNVHSDQSLPLFEDAAERRRVRAVDNGRMSGVTRAQKANSKAFNMLEDIARGATRRQCMAKYGISQATYYNWLKRSMRAEK